MFGFKETVTEGSEVVENTKSIMFMVMKQAISVARLKRLHKHAAQPRVQLTHIAVNCNVTLPNLPFKMAPCNNRRKQE